MWISRTRGSHGRCCLQRHGGACACTFKSGCVARYAAFTPVRDTIELNIESHSVYQRRSRCSPIETTINSVRQSDALAIELKRESRVWSGQLVATDLRPILQRQFFWTMLYSKCIAECNIWVVLRRILERELHGKIVRYGWSLSLNINNYDTCVLFRIHKFTVCAFFSCSQRTLQASRTKASQSGRGSRLFPNQQES